MMTIEAACNRDEEGVLQLVERMADFTHPKWRSQQEIVDGDKRVIEKWFSSVSKDHRFLFVAKENSRIQGFVLLERRKDYFNKNEILHVSILAVDRLSEGKGIGSALMRFAESKAVELSIDTLSLNVFGTNQGARRLYRKFGYQEEIISMIKKIN